MIKVGITAVHQNARESFGRCQVLEINEPAGTALVRWDVPRVKRQAERPGREPLTEYESHVNLNSLRPVE